MNDIFNIVIPAEFQKSKDGNWKIAGLASTNSIDQQGEIIIQKGLDLSPIKEKKGYFNWDHLPGPENIIGTIDGYKQLEKGLYVEGRLFKNHSKAKAVQEIMESLGEGDHGRIGMSVEGKVLERDPINPKIIKKCQISKVAITMNPVNSDTYADLVKSLNTAEVVEFDSSAKSYSEDDVVRIIAKALSISAGNAIAPVERTGGDALGKEELETKDHAQDAEKVVEPKELKQDKKPLPKKSAESLAKSMTQILDKLQVLYPDYPRTTIWKCLKERLTTKYDVKDLDQLKS